MTDEAIHTDCPSEEELAGYLLGEAGTLPDEVAAHVHQCSKCSGFVAEVRENDLILDSLRRVMDVESDLQEDAPTRTHVGGHRGSWGSDTPMDASDSGTYATLTPDSTHIEGYRILSELGRGGMGVVYKAIQTSTKRQVALKVLLEGPIISRTARRRFEREVELAAQLSHSNIVTILESGIASGRYYFAMQYVEGQRLDHYIADRNLELEAKLLLFVKICRAVNYAHQRGVIHRDLKPSNIIVDEHGEPHVLDFGLAKLADKDVGEEHAMISMTGQVMGTLPYMSPEQTTGSSSDIDTRTDVYSLGVILYEMLTGRYPYTVVGKMMDVLRNIAEAEPERPSTVLRTINNEIETIVLKSLAKDKMRRYQSADNLATDVERYLSGEPIEAKLDSATYVLWKMLKRHRVPVGVVAGFFILLVLGVGLSLKHRRDMATARAFTLSARLVDQPAEAIPAILEARPRVKSHLVERATQALNSAAYTERVVGARGGLLLDPDAFWASVNGGPLWTHGEWLELLRLPEEERQRLVPQLTRRLASGSPRERYVALCVLAHIPDLEQDVLDAVRDVMKTCRAPGVIMASRWVLQRHGEKASLPEHDGIIADALTGMTFVQIPGTERFTLGASPDDPDALPDEKQADQPVPVAAFYLAKTELTFDAFMDFLMETKHQEMLHPDAVAWLAARQDVLQTEEANRVAMGMMSHSLARAYCDWLTNRAADQSPRRRYRLPSETEWEYACRAGNPGRFCYGRDADYLDYFARCNGDPVAMHRVAAFLPNYYGVFDMHGGVWELCSTRYPDALVPASDLDARRFIDNGASSGCNAAGVTTPPPYAAAPRSAITQARKARDPIPACDW